MSVFSEADLDRLAAPHVGRMWFLELDLPSGIHRLHNGTGRKTIGGHEWRGVTDPLGGQLVSMSSVEEPRFGQAVAVDISLSSANLAFFKSFHDVRGDIEGRRADIYFAVFDAETEEVLIGLRKLFPGKITAPKLKWQGIGLRAVSITVESIWAGMNFPFGGKWNDADQRRRYPGDRGLQFVGVDVSETWG